MYKSIIHRISSFVLIVLMLSASTGFTVDMHYCGGKMQSYSLFGKAESCVAMDLDKDCTNSDHDSEANRHCTLEMKKCCEDRMLYIQPIEDLNVSVYSFSTEISDLTIAVFDTHTWSVNLPDTGTRFMFQKYRPPVLLRTTPVVLQSFLI